MEEGRRGGGELLNSDSPTLERLLNLQLLKNPSSAVLYSSYSVARNTRKKPMHASGVSCSNRRHVQWKHLATPDPTDNPLVDARMYDIPISVQWCGMTDQCS